MEAKVQTYNYKCPDRISKNQLRSLRFVHDRFSRNISSAISAFLRKVVEISLEDIEQVSYGEFLATVSDPTCYSSVSLKPLEGTAALDIAPEAIFTILDRLLGGSGKPLDMERSMTEIEQKVVIRFLKLLVDNLREAWRHIYPIEFSVIHVETHPQMVQIVSPTDMVVLFKFQMRTHEVTTKINLAIPTLVLEPIMCIFDREWSGRKKAAASLTLAGNIEKMPVKVAIETGETSYPIRSIQSLQVGDTLVLDQRQDLPVVIRVGGHEKLRVIVRFEANRKSFEIVETATSVTRKL